MSLSPLRPLVGRWEGQATVSALGREPAVLWHTEHVRARNAGTILTIEGRSFPPAATADADPVFTAFAVVTPRTDGGPRLHAYSSGSFVESPCEVAEGQFAWTFPGRAPVRYEATFDTEHWIEVGRCGESEVFRMELRRAVRPPHRRPAPSLFSRTR
ncbi:MAG: hypothetical protein ACRDMV_08860 [Streptosporangiales bacterium]